MMHAHKSPAGSRGVATVLAVALIAVMGMAITAMIWRLGYEATGRKTDRVQAELRQLLLAGAADSPRLFTERRDTWQVPLPQHLAERRGSVTLRTVPTDRDFEKLVEVEAALDGITARQTLRYARAEQGWGLVEASLEIPKRDEGTGPRAEENASLLGPRP